MVLFVTCLVLSEFFCTSENQYTRQRYYHNVMHGFDDTALNFVCVCVCCGVGVGGGGGGSSVFYKMQTS